MPSITINLTDTENKCLEYEAYSVEEWIQNCVDVRVQKARIEIINKLVKHCNANSIALAVGEDAQVQQAYDLGVADTAENRTSSIGAEPS